ncbi:MAG TPA: hypothetical protein VKQ27_11110 [Acetobacteraceae bacterium]|nr:hypothetical protein [Acetobacteraceae bacterium]
MIFRRVVGGKTAADLACLQLEVQADAKDLLAKGWIVDQRSPTVTVYPESGTIEFTFAATPPEKRNG